MDILDDICLHWKHLGYWAGLPARDVSTFNYQKAEKEDTQTSYEGHEL